jgi:hypothetical protein
VVLATAASTTPVKVPTILSYDGAPTADYHDATTLSATLTDDSLNPVPGKTVSFALNATETCSASTDATSLASCSVTPGEAAGSYTVTASYSDTTDPMYSTSSASIFPFTVTKEETTTTYTGPTVILQGVWRDTQRPTFRGRYQSDLWPDADPES